MDVHLSQTTVDEIDRVRALRREWLATMSAEAYRAFVDASVSAAMSMTITLDIEREQQAADAGE